LGERPQQLSLSRARRQRVIADCFAAHHLPSQCN
jgi:hypothetical protein